MFTGKDKSMYERTLIRSEIR